LYWEQKSTDHRSEISLSFTDSDDARAKRIEDWNNRPRTVLSKFEVGTDKYSNRRNPIDSVRIVLTILSVITELSNRFGRLTHIVRANAQSKPLFDFLTSLGIYYHSDEAGNRVDSLKKWAGDSILYCCNYPIPDLPDLSAYAPMKFLDVLSQEYLDHAMKLQDSSVEK